MNFLGYIRFDLTVIQMRLQLYQYNIYKEILINEYSD